MSYFSLYFNIISLSNIHSPQVPEPAEEGEILDDDAVADDNDDDAVADDDGDTEDHDSSLNTQCKNDFKRVFKQLQTLFPDDFDTHKLNRAYCTNPSSTPLLVLDYKDDPSWFYPEDGHFPTNVLPPSRSKIFPPDFNINVAIKRPPYFSFKDSKIKELLEAKPLDKALLDSLAFVDSNPIGIKSFPSSNIDSLLRVVMYDFMIMDKLFTFMVDLLQLSKLEFAANSAGGRCESPAFDLLTDVMSIAARTSLKASQFLTAAFIANRVALRDSVLEKFSAHETSKETLRGSSFASKNLFGPLPDQFKDKLNAPHGERFMLSLKSHSGSSLSAKRRGSVTSLPHKRRKIPITQSFQSSAFQRLQGTPAKVHPSRSTAPNFQNFQSFQNTRGKSQARGFQKRRGGYN